MAEKTAEEKAKAKVSNISIDVSQEFHDNVEKAVAKIVKTVVKAALEGKRVKQIEFRKLRNQWLTVELTVEDDAKSVFKSGFRAGHKRSNKFNAGYDEGYDVAIRAARQAMIEILQENQINLIQLPNIFRPDEMKSPVTIGDMQAIPEPPIEGATQIQQPNIQPFLVPEMQRIREAQRRNPGLLAGEFPNRRRLHHIGGIRNIRLGISGAAQAAQAALGGLGSILRPTGIPGPTGIPVLAQPQAAEAIEHRIDQVDRRMNAIFEETERLFNEESELRQAYRLVTEEEMSRHRRTMEKIYRSGVNGFLMSLCAWGIGWALHTLYHFFK